RKWRVNPSRPFSCLRVNKTVNRPLVRVLHERTMNVRHLWLTGGLCFGSETPHDLASVHPALVQETQRQDIRCLLPSTWRGGDEGRKLRCRKRLVGDEAQRNQGCTTHRGGSSGQCFPRLVDGAGLAAARPGEPGEDRRFSGRGRAVPETQGASRTDG